MRRFSVIRIRLLFYVNLTQMLVKCSLKLENISLYILDNYDSDIIWAEIRRKFKKLSKYKTSQQKSRELWSVPV